MNNKDNVVKICRSAYLTLRNISRTRSTISINTAKILVQSLVISKIDYCNALLLGTPKHLLDRLQRIQNMGARVILGLTKFDHVSASMFDLHWLKIEYRVLYTVCTIVFKARMAWLHRTL